MNNKGFAITTILYGTFLLFMMLLLTMRGILSNYKHKMDILVDNTNGARDIVDIYKADFHFMTLSSVLGSRKYYKKNSGVAMVGIVSAANGGDYCTGPLLISTDPDAVAYYTSYEPEKVWTSSGSVVHLGTTYYYSSGTYWMCTGTYTNSLSMYSYKTYSGATTAEAAKKMLEETVKYYVNNE